MNAGGVAEHADVRTGREVRGELRRVAGPRSELVRVDDRERVERQRVEGEPHAVEREVVQPSPRERPRPRVDERVAAGGCDEARVEERRVAAAVVEQDRRVRVEEAQVAHEVEDDVAPLVHENRVDVVEPGHTRCR